MGIKVPPEWPEIDDTKTYKVTVDGFQGGGPPNDCSMNFVARVTCCKLGNLLNAYIDNDLECIGGNECCVISGFTAQRIKAIEGPYDTFVLCQADL